jgi:hypothetical protein
MSSGHTINLEDEMVVAQWPAPTIADVTGGRKTRSGERSDEMLLNGLMAQWNTPTARDHFPPHAPEYIAKHKANGHGMANLNDQMAIVSGPTPNGSNAQTEKPGAPNPVFACWLMGWPDELTYGALQAIASYRESRRKSSRRSSKRHD